MLNFVLRRLVRPLGVAYCFYLSISSAAFAQAPDAAPTPVLQRPTLIHKVQAANERLEMTVNTSRILTMDQKIPQAQVNNPDILELTPLSPTEIQVSAKAAGVTQVNLWGEDKKISTIDVIVFQDGRALEMLLRSQFPTASLRVVPIGGGVLIGGYVDRPDYVDLIVRIAEEYYPKVINAITVGGVQQVLLHVKVMEVSRTKLRRLGFDWAEINGSNFFVSGISGLITSTTGGALATTGHETFTFGLVDGKNAFFGVLEALRQNDMAKLLADPTLVTVSGRPAQFNSGGEFPVPVPQSLGTISIEFKKYGTQLDFIPIVLGNGAIHLDVRPRVSEIDNSHTLTIAGTTVPGLRMREVETGVEMEAGQTLAIAGLVYQRTEAQNRGLPWISDVPYLGALFRKTSEESNEIELLIMVTPELVEPMNADQVPPCGPGSFTASPNDWELYMRGYIEVPNCCPPCTLNQPCGNMPCPAPDGMIGPVDQSQSTGAVGMSKAAASTAAMNRQGREASNSRQSRTGPSKSQNRSNPVQTATASDEPGLIGPVGYDPMN